MRPPDPTPGVSSAADAPRGPGERVDTGSDGLDPELPEPELVGGVSDDSLPLRTRLRSLYRLFVVLGAFLPFAVALLRDRRRWLLFGDGRERTEADDRRRARKLRETLLDLGPAFIKFGQMLSTRPDVLPPAYVEELAALQDRVPPAPWPEAREVLEGELGPVDEVFAAFEREPISGASIGQVYVARLDEGGAAGRGPTDVAVKVLRPGVRPRVEADLRIIRTLLPLVTRLAPPGQRFTLENLADEYAATIRQEMDYAHEARRQELVRANFADDPGVRIPPVVAGLTTDRVIVSQYVEGTKISNVSTLRSMGVDTTELAERLLRTYIRMILEDGVFHADPHPGNLAVTPDGRVVFYDFGIVGRVSDETRDGIFDFYVAISRNDVDNMINAFIDMGALDPEVDREIARRMFNLMLDNVRGREIDDERVEDLIDELQEEMYEFPMRVPRDLALLFRTTTVLEGIFYTLDDDYDFFPVIRDYLVRKRMGPVGRTVVNVAGTADRLISRFVSMLPERTR